MKPHTFRLIFAALAALIAAPAVNADTGDVLASAPLALITPRDVAVAADGSLWVIDEGSLYLIHLSSDGQTILGALNTSDYAKVPTGIGIGSDGTLYIVDQITKRIYHRNTNGSVAGGFINLSALGIHNPLSLDVTPGGRFLVMDGVLGTSRLYQLDTTGTVIESSVSASMLSNPVGVALGASNTLWVTDADSSLIYHLSSTGTLLGTTNLAAAGVVSPRGLDLAPGGTIWTVDGDSSTLVHHTTAGNLFGSPAVIDFSSVAGLGIRGASGISIEDSGTIWLVDANAGKIRKLSPDLSEIVTSFDFPAGSGIVEVDVAPDGTLYLTDSGSNTVYHVSSDGAQVLNTFSAAQLHVGAVNALGVDTDGTLWVLDPGALVVKHLTADAATVLSSFALPPAVPNPTDIEVAYDGTLWIADSQGGASTLNHFLPNGTPSAPIAQVSIGVGGLDAPESLIVLKSGDLIITDVTNARLITIEGPPPVISRAIHVDITAPTGVSAGDQLVLVFDQPVLLAGTLESNDFQLSLAGDSLGNFTAAANPFNSTHVVLTLGAGVQLTIPGSGSGSSGIDVSSAIEVGDIIDATTSTPVLPSFARDIQFNMIPSGDITVGTPGGTVSVVDSADAVYRTHHITFAVDAFGSEQTVALDTPSLATGLVNAVEVTPANFALANAHSTMTLGYTENDFFNGDGGGEQSMRIHQLIDQGDGTFEAVPLPGVQTVDPSDNTVTAPLSGTNPMSSGTLDLFATLPLDTLDNEIIILERVGGSGSGGRARQGIASGTPPRLTFASEGVYTQHSIEFPGYVEAATGITVTVSEPNIFERAGFPVSSGAVFTLEATQDISDPVNISIQYRPNAGSGDVVSPHGLTGDPGRLRLMRRTDPLDPFEFVEGPQTVINENNVTTTGITGLTENGRAVYGVAVNPEAPIATTDVSGWTMYR